MSPADALDRVVYLLDRALAEGRRVAAYAKARDWAREAGDDEVGRLHRAGELLDQPGIGKSTGHVIALAIDGGIDEHLAQLEAESAIDPGEGAALRAALKGDCHSHTTWSDGGAATAEMARTAMALGHEYLVVTDHSPRLTIAHGLNRDRLLAQLEEIEALNAELAPFRILTGMEVDILEDGSLDQDLDLLERLDVVVASVHSKLRMPEKDMTRRMVLAAANPHVDILGHCTGRKVVGAGRPQSQFDADIVFAACARFGTAVEINCRPERQDPPEELLSLALDWDCLVSIDTDAHAPGQLEWQAYGCDKAARLRIESERIINTMDADDLIDWTTTHADRLTGSAGCGAAGGVGGRASGGAPHPGAIRLRRSPRTSPQREPKASPEQLGDEAPLRRRLQEREQHHLGAVGDQVRAGGIPEGEVDAGVAVAGVAGPVVREQPPGGRRPEEVEGVVDARREPRARVRTELLTHGAGHGVAQHEGPGGVEGAVRSRRRVVQPVPERRLGRAVLEGLPGARPMTGRASTTSSQNRIGGKSNSNTTPSGSGSRKPRTPSGPATSGMTSSVKSKPRRGAPKAAMAVRPAAAPGFRTVAESCDIDRPRRRTVTSTSTGPPATWPANMAVIVRSVWSGWPSTRSIARTAMAATTPPCGTTASCHVSLMLVAKQPSPTSTRSRSSQPVPMPGNLATRSAAPAGSSVGPAGLERTSNRPVAWHPYVEAHEEGDPPGSEEEGQPRPQAEPRPQLVATALAEVPPPPPTRADDLVETLAGIEVADPYRWLEDGTSSEVRAWTTAQNERTRTALDALPARGRFRARLAELTQAGTATAPSVRGDRLFTIDRWGDRDRAALVVRSIDAAVTGPGRVLLDPADASGEVTSAIDWYEPSPDGDLVAFGTSTGGDERSTLHVLEVDTLRLRSDEIAHTRAASVAWRPDGSGFAYTRYPDPSEVGDEEAGYHRTVWWHDLGADSVDDRPCFTDLPTKEAWPEVSLSADGRWLLVHIELGWSRTDVHLHDCRTGTWATVVEGVEANTWLRVDGERQRLVGTTTLDAPRGRLIAAIPGAPGPEGWVDLVPEGDDVLSGFALTGEHLIVLRNRAGVSSLHHHEPSGAPVADLPEITGGLAAVTGLASHPSRPDLVAVAHTSFTRPDTVTGWRPDAAPAALVELPGPTLEPTRVAQVRYPSDDGVEIPLLLVHGAQTPIGPDTPTLLTGYGGFNITETPAWSPFVAAWCEAGGQLAVAGLRGGGEEGEAWHQAGIRERKPQVFADFEAAADWLVAEGRTSRTRLGIRGGSNGGLLVAACTTRRPDLCQAVVCEVPLTDMVRFPRFLIARLWIPEYGDPEVPEELAWLYAYSPYHQVVEGACYPSTLITTGEEDSRVDPCHARKLAARLQAATACGDQRPVLLRVESAAGHGQGKPATKQIEERADVLAFLTTALAGPG